MARRSLRIRVEAGSCVWKCAWACQATMHCSHSPAKCVLAQSMTPCLSRPECHIPAAQVGSRPQRVQLAWGTAIALQLFAAAATAVTAVPAVTAAALIALQRSAPETTSQPCAWHPHCCLCGAAMPSQSAARTWCDRGPGNRSPVDYHGGPVALLVLGLQISIFWWREPPLFD